ncbi:MAG: ATP-dependent DNA helicase RecG [Candidatus Saccharimonadales bacterium]
MTLDSPISEISGVGEAIARKYAYLGINTIADLINYYPRKYEDYSVITSIAKLRPGPVTIEAKIKQVSGRYVRRGMHITEAIASDKTGSIRVVWFNQPYRSASIKRDNAYYISGPYELRRQHFSLLNPSIEQVQSFPKNTARILAVYRETKGLTSSSIRKTVANIRDLFDGLPETLPTWVIKEHKLMTRTQALKSLHMPESNDDLKEAKRRLGFEEVFCLSLASLLNKKENQKEKAPSIPYDVELAKKFVKHLPFDLTNAQRKAVWKIYQDLDKKHPMNRLLEGDVGSGKTVVAAMAALIVIHNKMQAAFMAPTELLARQHYETIFELLKPLKLDHKVSLLVGSLSKAAKQNAHEAIETGKAQFIIGTQALIQDTFDMHNLAFVIIDEQHRFGVDQRKKLMAKAGHMPHLLSMSATPIPRSLALTIFGEMDISILDEKPSGRLPIQTEIVSPNSKAQLYEKVEKELEKGKQMFVVCPVIVESDLVDKNSAEKVFKELSTKVFKHRKVGLLHGKLKSDEKNKIMDQFIDHELDILVATTVIEVGVDVPNASIMMIENADKFGLAQLHQLRGRVGRSSDQGYCYLILSDSKPPSPRIRALETIQNGFKLAELDLEFRGPGAVYGVSQHGALDLRLAPITDTRLIATARSAAESFIEKKEKLSSYPNLNSIVSKLRRVTNLN